MFKGKSLAVLTSVLVTVTCVVIYLEWRAVQDIRKGLSGAELKSLFAKSRHVLLHRMVISGGHSWGGSAAAAETRGAADRPRVGTDLKIIVDDGELEVHSVILELASPVFASMLSSAMKEGTGDGTIQLPGKCKSELESFYKALQLCTMEEMPGFQLSRYFLMITPAMAVFLSKWADEYQIQALTEKCEQILVSQPVDGAALQHAVKYNLPRRRAQCIGTMQRNIEKYIDNLSVLTSRECEEHLKALWPQMVKAAGLPDGTALPPVEHLKSMWPFLAQAVHLQVKAVNYAQLRAEAQLWPRPPAPALRGASTTILSVAGSDVELRPDLKISTELPSFPTPREVRHPSCIRDFDLQTLPRASLVIPYLNETWAQISATVASLVAHSPLEVVDEILFIDDGNAPEWQHHDELLALHPKVKVHRNEVRQGLIRAKVIGAALIHRVSGASSEGADKWRNLLLLMKIYRKLAFWRPRFKFMSARDLTQTLYDKDIDKGGGDIFLDMKELVLNDQDAPNKASERKVRIEVFDSDFACFLDFLMLINVSLTMVTAPLTFLWDGRWGDESSVPGGRDLLLLDLCLDLIYALYLLLMLEMSYLHPERRTEIVTRRRVIRSRLRSPLYWLKWLSVSAYFWVLAFDAPLIINLLKVIRGGVFVELPDSFWRLREASEVRLAKPILLLMGIAHWVASCLFSFGGYLEYMQTNGVEASETSFRGQTVDGRISSYVVAYVEALYMLTGE
eukprot:s2029_g7.t3